MIHAAPIPMSIAGEIVLELKLPVSIEVIAAIAKALREIHGEDTIVLREVGPMLQFLKPTPR